jgi:hypothetical protein
MPKYGNAVTDPDLLSKLNASNESKFNYGAPVNDPNLLSMLNNEQQEPNTIIGNIPNASHNFKKDFSNLGVKFPLNSQERSIQNQKMNDALKGAAQQLANYGVKGINIFRNKPISEFNFAPKTEEAKRGKLAVDIGSFFIPGAAGTSLLKGLGYIPKIGAGINAISKAIEANKYYDSLAKILGTGASSGIYNAIQNKPENAASSFGQGAALGGGTQAAINMLTSKNPLLHLLARMGVGSGIGASVGHPYMGAAIGAGFPSLVKELGVKNQNNEILEGLQPKDIMAAKAANDRLKTPITPAQASGNYVTAGLEGNLKRTPQGAQTAYRLEESQKRAQKNALNNMLDSIYKPTAENEENINKLYELSDRKKISPNIVKIMKKNPVLRSSFNTVASDPAFANIPRNSYKFLSEVDRQLYRDYKNALNERPNSAHIVNNVKSQFTNFLRNHNEDYANALKASKPKMVRQEIESKFNKNEEDFTGKNFYNKFLNTKKSTQDLLRTTKDFPEAQQAIKDMRSGWKHLSNMKTVSQGEAQAKTGIADARDHLKVVWNAMKKMSGAKKDVEGLKFIYSKDWDKELEKIMQKSDATQRKRDMASLFAKMGMAAGLQNPDMQ